jgi:1,4-dihydroxy-2-naphthoate octaprenyltransferase
MTDTQGLVTLSYKGLGGVPVWILIGVVVLCVAVAFAARSRKK